MPKVREVEFSDYESVCELLRSGAMGVPALDKWYHLWDRNPAIQPDGPKLSRGWVLEEGSRIVGFVYNIAQKFQIGDRALFSAFPGSLIVAPEFRGQSMQLVLPFMRQKGIDLFLNTTCSAETAQIFQFMKFQKLPQLEYDQHLYWILREGKFLNSAFRKKGLPGALSQVAGTLLAPALWAEGRIRGRKPRANRSSLEIRPIEVAAAGVEFDDLWRRKIAEGRKLLAMRDAATLRWHFAARDRTNPPFFVGAFDGAKLVGYAAVLFANQPNYQLLRAFLADLCVEHNDPATIRLLLSGAAQHARSRGATLFEAVGLPELYRNVCREFRPRVRKMNVWPYYYKSVDPALHAELASATMWHASLYDGDGSI